MVLAPGSLTGLRRRAELGGSSRDTFRVVRVVPVASPHQPKSVFRRPNPRTDESEQGCDYKMEIRGRGKSSACSLTFGRRLGSVNSYAYSGAGTAEVP